MLRWPIFTLIIAVQSLVQLEWYSPFFSGGGYCSEAISFVQALTKHVSSKQLELKIIHHGDSYNPEFLAGLPRETLSMLHALVNTRFSQFDARTMIRVAICHSEPGAWHPAKYSTSRCPPERSREVPASRFFRIGRTMFETDRLPSGWASRLNSMDFIWVPTQFSYSIFQREVSSEKLRILGEPVDTDFFSSSKPGIQQLSHPQLEGLSGTFKFLSVFKFEERKGWRFLVKAFVQEFDPSEPIALIILTSLYHSSANILDEFQKEIGDGYNLSNHRIILIDSHLPTEDLPNLYYSSDAFVLPSRGEGWGRPHVEAMAMGLPIISTFWSGPEEFMNPNNSYPLQIEGMDEITEGPFRTHKWARPDLEHLKALMRHVFLNQEEARGKGSLARKNMQEKYCPRCLAFQLLRMLAELVPQTKKQGIAEEL
jgi:glycosyltransferase involved in cell wall biosynthesis